MINRKEKEDTWKLQSDLDRLWSLCNWLKYQRAIKKISPDQVRTVFSLMIIILKESMKALGVKGDEKRTAFTHDVLKNNELFREKLFDIIYPKKN